MRTKGPLLSVLFVTAFIACSSSSTAPSSTPPPVDGGTSTTPPDDAGVVGVVDGGAASGGPGKPGPSANPFNHPYYTCSQNFYVSTTGDDGHDGTTPATAWATIAHADTAAR